MPETEFENTVTEPRKLHIGGKIPHPEWEIFNALENPAVDHVGDAKDLSRFEDGIFESVYASHVLEHFDYNGELAEVLKEWTRVLMPKGKLYISVPDMEVLCRLYLDHERFDAALRFGIMRMMFGGHLDKYDYHYVGFNLELLRDWLMLVGFTEIWKMESFGLFDDTSELLLGGERISLNLLAIKDP
ncbi:MAG: methyltransferase domain-containing protein [Gammaproteobacteria bacterium]|nr:methyltransferase domain-containing protein [Gammaproteobacteria bacterium]